MFATHVAKFDCEKVSASNSYSRVILGWCWLACYATNGN